MSANNNLIDKTGKPVKRDPDDWMDEYDENEEIGGVERIWRRSSPPLTRPKKSAALKAVLRRGKVHSQNRQLENLIRKQEREALLQQGQDVPYTSSKRISVKLPKIKNVAKLKDE